MTTMNKQGRPYQPIDSYGVIGDGHSVLFIAPDGSMDWGCLPDFDSPAIFCRSLDVERGGYFQVAPSDPTVMGSQHYLTGSNVLQTTFTCTTGKIVLTDFMPIETLHPCSYRTLDNNTWTQQDGSCHCLVRHVTCSEGELPITMTLKVTPNHAASPSEVLITPNEPGAIISGGNQYVGLFIAGAQRVSAFSLPLSQDDTNPHPSVIAQITLHEGERIQFVLGVGRTPQAAHRLVTVELPRRNFDWELAYTLSCWRQWIADSSYEGPYRDWIERSVLTLKMLIHAPTGAIIAVPIASLSEEEQGERNMEDIFTVCTFRLIDYLILQGRLAEATSLFERVLTCAGPLGLFSEEIRLGSDSALRNYRQALTHIALINSAVNLQIAEKRISKSA